MTCAPAVPSVSWEAGSNQEVVMSKLPFVLGMGIGYVLGTRAGRAQYERIKKATTAVWESKPVQGAMHKADETVGDMARTQAARLTDQVAGIVKERIHAAGRKPAEPTATTDDIQTGYGSSSI